MKLTAIASAIFILTTTSGLVNASGLDRSGQSINAFLQPGNYAEAGISVLDPTVKGTSRIDGQKISDMGDDYYFPSAAIKVQATDHISLGLLYDQPFGADATYGVDSGTFNEGNQTTKVKVRTNNITALIGYQPTKNWNVYAGPVWQTVEADISLRGAAYGGTRALGTYDIKVDQEEAWGWLAGFAYQIPEIGLKAAVTYRSEIEHNAKSKETLGFGAMNVASDKVQAVTPQSVNIDLQTGISQNNLIFANVRWVHWDQFVVSPKFLKSYRQDLISYSDDQWSINAGLGHKFNDKWSGSATVGWDSGAGNPVTTLGPTEGYWSVGLGGQYSPTASTFIQAGVKYYGLGDAVAKTGNSLVADFEDNYAIGYGLKIGYKF